MTRRCKPILANMHYIANKAKEKGGTGKPGCNGDRWDESLDLDSSVVTTAARKIFFYFLGEHPNLNAVSAGEKDECGRRDSVPAGTLSQFRARSTA